MAVEFRHIELIVSNSSSAPMEVGVEPVGMLFTVLPNDSVTIEADLSAHDELETTRWDGGISLWLLGEVSVYGKERDLLERFESAPTHLAGEGNRSSAVGDSVKRLFVLNRSSDQMLVSYGLAQVFKVPPGSDLDFLLAPDDSALRIAYADGRLIVRGWESATTAPP